MNKTLKNICLKLGENNKAVYAVLAIAIFKGIFRPTFTMMDKHTDPTSKKYAAFREGLTEVIAFMTYFGVDKAVEQLAKPLTKNHPEKLPQVKKSLGFIGVCLSALAVIPAACNLTLKPIMNIFGGKKQNIPSNNKLDVKENAVSENVPVKINKPIQLKSTNLMDNYLCNLATQNSNMKVGG